MKAPKNAAGLPLRERILAFGPWKTGKTVSYLKIAAMHQKRNSPATFFIVDTDFAMNRMLAPSTDPNLDFSKLQNVVYEEVSDWHEVVTATNQFREKIKEGDWLVIDMASPLWEQCYGSWIKKVYGEDLDTLIARKMIEKGLKDKGSTNMGDILGDLVSWPAVNRRWYPFAQSLISHRGHLFLVAGQTELRKKEEDDTRAMFGQWGVKPEGQKRLPHLVHDLYRFQSGGQNQPPRISSISRPGRKSLVGESVPDFSLLLLKAGWTL